MRVNWSKIINRWLQISFLIVFLFASLISSLMASESTPSAETTGVNYQLSYPGILPDHRLYILKVLRDKIYDRLLRDPVARVQFRLTTADKRLFMGIMLWEKDKKRLAESTISKGSKYFEDAYESYEEARKAKRDVSQFRDTLILAALKHEEIIGGLMQDTDVEMRSGFNESLGRVSSIRYKLETQKLQ